MVCGNTMIWKGAPTTPLVSVGMVSHKMSIKQFLVTIIKVNKSKKSSKKLILVHIWNQITNFEATLVQR